MNYKEVGLPITDFINRNQFLSVTTNAILNLLFSIIRIGVRPFKYKNGVIVIISLHRLGDTIFTIPAVREILKHYGKKVVIYCFPESIPIYNLEFSDLKFCSVNREEFYFQQRIAKHSAKFKLKSLKPETIIDLTCSMISASLLYNIKANKIIGSNRLQFKALYDSYIVLRENPHLIDLYLDACKPLVQAGNRINLKKQKIVFNPVGKLLIHPFAGWRAKEWNFNKYYELAINLSRYYKISLIVPINTISNDVINEILLERIELIESQSVENLIEHIKLCSLFIGNDSGPIYIASLLCKPTISIYGPTNSEYSKPIGERHKVIANKLRCSPEKNKQYCITTGGLFGCPSFECMNLLKYDDVYKEVKECINKIFL